MLAQRWGLFAVSITGASLIVSFRRQEGGGFEGFAGAEQPCEGYRVRRHQPGADVPGNAGCQEGQAAGMGSGKDTAEKARRIF